MPLLSQLTLALSPLQVRTALRDAGVTAREGPITTWELSAGEMAVLYLVDWLKKRKPVADEPMACITATFGKTIAQSIDVLEEYLQQEAESLPTVQLLILDSTLVVMSGVKGYLDLRSGDVIDGPTQLPIEITAINLTAMYCLHKKRLLDVPQTKTG